MPLSDHLDKISAFAVIAETGKLNEAAKRLHLSQPSLTRLIQTLEDASGARLFHRGRQGVSLTPAGELLLTYAKSTLTGLGDLEVRLQNPALEQAGLLRVGSYESLAEYLWPKFIAAFKKTAPELKIAIRTSDSSAHQRALETGALDMLVDAEPRLLGDFTSWRLYDDHFSFYASETFPATLDPAAIASVPLIFCPAAFDNENKSISQLLEEKGYFFREKMELDSFPAVKTFAQHGMGLAVLPKRLAEDSTGGARKLRQVSLKGISAGGIGPHSIYASVCSSRVSDPRITLLVKELRKWFR